MRVEGCKSDCPAFLCRSYAAGLAYVSCVACNRQGPVAVHGGNRTEEETYDIAIDYWKNFITTEKEDMA